MGADDLRFRQAVTEAANRAEATALLIRCKYRVYRPEADLEGEDLVVRTPAGELHGVQLKGRPIVDWKRYGARDLWMLFPSATYVRAASRLWFLIPHDHLFDWAERRHGKAPKWDGHWSYPTISKDLAAFIAEYELVERGCRKRAQTDRRADACQTCLRKVTPRRSSRSR